MNFLAKFVKAFRSLFGRSTASVDTKNDAKFSVEKVEKIAVTERRDATVDVEGTCSYMAFRRFLFVTLHPHTPQEILARPRVLIEGRSNPEQVHIEADHKSAIYALNERFNLISVGHVLGIIYRSNASEIRWREPQRIWGRATPKIVELLRRNGIRVKTSGEGKAAQPESGGRLEQGKLETIPKWRSL